MSVAEGKLEAGQALSFDNGHGTASKKPGVSTQDSPSTRGSLREWGGEAVFDLSSGPWGCLQCQGADGWALAWRQLEHVSPGSSSGRLG